MNAKAIAALVLVGGVVVFVAFDSCGDPGEAEVKAAVDAMVVAVQNGDADELARFVAPDYSDRLGHDASGVVRRTLHEVEHYDEVKIELASLSIDVDSKRGMAKVGFRPVFHGDADTDRKRHPKYQFSKGQKLILQLRRYGDGEWRIYRATVGFSLSDAL